MPVLPGMLDVEEGEVGPQFVDQLHRFLAVLGFADDLQFRPDLGQSGAQQVAHQSFVIGNDCSRHGGFAAVGVEVSIIQRNAASGNTRHYFCAN
jgi:hypothetical protein